MVFTAIGAMRGIGWVALVHDAQADRLLNLWINEHDAGHLAGTTPLLVMDVFEHAFMTDYGVDKPKYIAAYWNAVQWSEVERRFEAHAGIGAEKTEE
jgi:superoxide dismutase, Fe-Mn family